MLEQITEKTVWHKTISEIKLKNKIKINIKTTNETKVKRYGKVATFPFHFFLSYNAAAHGIIYAVFMQNILHR